MRVFFVFVAAFLATSFWSSNAMATQEGVCSLINEARQMIEETDGNPLKRKEALGLISANLPDLLAQRSGGGDIVGWSGKLDALTVNHNDKINVTVTTPCGINFFTDPETLIPPDSDLARSLYEIDVGQDVVFSGSFVKGGKIDLEKGFPFKEASFSVLGAMRRPEFYFVFSAISKAE